MKNFIISIVFLSAIILVSCFPSEKPISTIQVFQTAKSTRSPLASIPMETLTPTLPAPTETVHINPQATQTQQVFDIKKTRIAAFPPTCDLKGRGYLSPSGNWLASTCDMKTGTLEIVNKAGKRWILELKDYVIPNDLSDGKPPYGYLFPVHWTEDEKYLFFSAYVSGDAGGICFYGLGASSLNRINLVTDHISSILPPRSMWNGYLLAFSPDGQWLAYSVDFPIIRNLQTGEDAILFVEDSFVGDLYWSPDSKQLAFATCQTNKGYNAILHSSVRVFSFYTHSSKTIMEVEKTFLSIQPIDENNLLQISDENWANNHVTISYYDWSTRLITQATPSP